VIISISAQAKGNLDQEIQAIMDLEMLEVLFKQRINHQAVDGLVQAMEE